MTYDEIRREIEAEAQRIGREFTRPLTPFGVRERVRSGYQELLNAEGLGGQASVGEMTGGTVPVTITYQR